MTILYYTLAGDHYDAEEEVKEGLGDYWLGRRVIPFPWLLCINIWLDRGMEGSCFLKSTLFVQNAWAIWNQSFYCWRIAIILLFDWDDLLVSTMWSGGCAVPAVLIVTELGANKVTDLKMGSKSHRLWQQYFSFCAEIEGLGLGIWQRQTYGAKGQFQIVLRNAAKTPRCYNTNTLYGLALANQVMVLLQSANRMDASRVAHLLWKKKLNAMITNLSWNREDRSISWPFAKRKTGNFLTWLFV